MVQGDGYGSLCFFPVAFCSLTITTGYASNSQTPILGLEERVGERTRIFARELHDTLLQSLHCWANVSIVRRARIMLLASRRSNPSSRWRDQ